MAPLINPAMLYRISDQAVILNQIIQIYLQSTPANIENIEAGVASGDSEMVAAAAHSLKGSSAELGGERLAELSQQLYAAAKAGNSELAAELANEVKHCHQETCLAMDALEFD